MNKFKASKNTTCIILTPAYRLVQELPLMEPSRLFTDGAVCQVNNGYLFAGFAYKEDTQETPNTLVMILKPVLPQLIELQSMQAFPGGKGSGTRAMLRLCELADKYQCQIWLDCRPYGTLSARPPVETLRRFYARLGFAHIDTVPVEWQNDFHKRYYRSFDYPMVRIPTPERVCCPTHQEQEAFILKSNDYLLEPVR